MKLTLTLPAINHEEETKKYLNSFKDNADAWQDIELMLIDNGSDKPMTEWGIAKESQIIRHDINTGVLATLQEAYKLSTGDYIFYTHNDVEMFEKGWDTKLKRILTDTPNVGVAGFFGAKGLGTGDIYQAPYVINQLARQVCVSGCTRMPSGHGYRLPFGETEKVAVMDGFSLIVSRKLLDELGGFDMSFPAHHNYDNDICMESLNAGYDNIVISMDAYHHGGMTDVHEAWNKPFGMEKAEIHRLAHTVMYEKWKPGKKRLTLPYMVP